jgi:predicted ATPase
MPLAIELAANWIEILSIEEIAAEIERSLDFLETSAHGIPDRQRSLRAVCDHSWSLLTEPEQRAMRGFSIFPGGFDRTAAEAIVGATPSLLRSLVSKSWLRRANDTAPTTAAG